ncbi:MAG: radical SAM protein [bacterium]|jgi:oxygen-independent coproporphyrinogen-3 oxidase
MNPADRADLLEIARGRVADGRRLQDAGLLATNGDFFPSVHYPPITMYPPIREEELFATYANPADLLFDVYAHIPFCPGRCLFCHYPVKYGDRPAEKERYLAALEKEMDLSLGRFGLGKIKARSILVGGGTPTFLTPGQLERFLGFFTDRLDRSRTRQFNYDVDPTTLIGPEGLERLAILKGFGVDRLTIGVQSLDPGVLGYMNRLNTVEQAMESIGNAKALGFQVNIEFIFGHPGQTLDGWIAEMERAVTLDADEIQLYRLKVEAYGDFQGAVKSFMQGKPGAMPGPEETIMMKQAAIGILSARGYHENLRRVFSRRRQDFSLYAHNQCCRLFDEIGFGLTAFSSLRDRFVLNTQHFDEYYRRIGEGRLPVNRGLVRSGEEQIRWAIVLPLKNRNVRKEHFRRVTGASLDDVFRGKIRALSDFGLVHEDRQVLELTPLGAFFADEVAQQFHNPDFLPFPRPAYAEGPLNPYRNTGVYT